MKYLDTFAYKSEETKDLKLFQGLATNYHIGALANKITATKNAKLNQLNLRNLGNLGNIANL